jgi:hypothetical protein
VYVSCIYIFNIIYLFFWSSQIITLFPNFLNLLSLSQSPCLCIMSSSEEYSFHDSNESQGSASPSVDVGKEMVLGQKAKE